MKEGCLEKLQKIYKGLPKEDIDNILKDVDHLKEMYPSPKELEKQITKYINDRSRGMAFEIKATAENSVKVKKNIEFANNPKFKNRPAQSIQAIADGVPYIVEGGNASINRAWTSLSQNYHSMLLQDLENLNLLDAMKTGGLDKEIYIHRHGEFRGKPANVSEHAKAASTVVGKLYNILQGDMEAAGSSRLRTTGYLRHQWNGLKVETATFEKWSADMMEHMDLDKSFGHLSRNEKFMKAELKDVFDSMVLGEYNSGVVSGFSGEVMKLKSRNVINPSSSKHRHFIFKNGESEFAIMEKYGKGTILENVFDSIEQDARSIAVIARLGTNPFQTIEAIKADLAKQAMGNPKAAKQIKASMKSMDALMENTIYGIRSGSSTLARVGQNARSLASMSKLGKTVLLSAPMDYVSAAAVLRSKTGMSYMGAHAKVVASYLENISPNHRREVAKRMGLYLNNQLGEIWSRFGHSEDMVSGTISKLENKFFKLNGMQKQTEIYKSGNADVYGQHLADISRNSFETLHPNDRGNLTRYGITSDDWAIISKAQEKVGSNNLVTPYALEQMDLPVAQKRELKVKLSSMIEDMSSYLMSPNPSMKEKTFLTGRTDPDSIGGQALRMASQFKNFGVTMQKIMQHLMYSDGDTAISTWREALTDKSAIRNMSAFILTTTSLSAMSIMLMDIAANRTPRDIDTVAFWTEAMVRGGSMGLYGDFIFANYADRSRSLSQDILGPVLGGTFNTMAEVWSGMRSPKKDVRKKASEVFNLLLREAPFNNLFWTRAILDYTILDDIQDSIYPKFTRNRKKSMRTRGQEPLID